MNKSNRISSFSVSSGMARLLACSVLMSMQAPGFAQEPPAAEVPSEVVIFTAPSALVSADNQDPNAGGPGSKMGWNIPGGNYRSGKGWWALVCDKEAKTGTGKAGCSLHTTQLSVTRGKHAVYDSEPVDSQMLYWSPLPAGFDRVPEANDERPLMVALFKPVGKVVKLNLHEGPITTYVHQGMNDFPSTQRQGTLEVRLPMPDGQYADIVPRIRISTKGTGDEPPQMEIATLELRFGKLRQQLPGFAYSGIDAGYQIPTRKDYLLWAGDLDGDGKPDLMLSHGDPGMDISLYLSSLAKEGELVGLAGQFHFDDPSSSGC